MKLVTAARKGSGASGRRPTLIRFMSFNIRFDTPADADAGNRWADRRGSVIETIQRFDPDVVGLQEVLRSQLDDLEAAFPDHGVIGEPRETGALGEYVPILFNRDRFEAEQHGDFWLSPTPETSGSRGWDAGNPRHCTWARLHDRSSGLRAAVFNTHLDRWGMLARVEAS